MDFIGGGPHVLNVYIYVNILNFEVESAIYTFRRLITKKKKLITTGERKVLSKKHFFFIARIKGGNTENYTYILFVSSPNCFLNSKKNEVQFFSG